MRFLFRLVLIAVLIALVIRVVRAAMEKLSGNVEVIPPPRRSSRQPKKVVVDQEDLRHEAESRRRAGRS